nr:unnamed protein product [uncultured bacterium]
MDMDKVIAELINYGINTKDNNYLTDLEDKLLIDQSKNSILTDIEILYFKRGLKAGLALFNYLDK